MTQDFLHPRYEISLDERLDNTRVECPNCGGEMWLDRVETAEIDGRTVETRSYSCKVCLEKYSVTKEEDVAPLLSR